MKLALDIDGTITQNPHIFRRLMENILEGGGLVYIITGCVGKEDKITTNPKHRIKQLEDLNIPQTCYTEILEVVRKGYLPIAWGKADLCRVCGIDLFIEDNTHYISNVHEYSKTQCLLIIPREGGGI